MNLSILILLHTAMWVSESKDTDPFSRIVGQEISIPFTPLHVSDDLRDQKLCFCTNYWVVVTSVSLRKKRGIY